MIVWWPFTAVNHCQRFTDFPIEFFSKPDFMRFMLEMDLGASHPSARISILREQTKLIVELCHFTEDLNPVWDAKSSYAALRALSHPVIEQCHALSRQSDQFALLSKTFFGQLGFRGQVRPSALKSCFLPEVLQSRKGPMSLVMLLFCSVCEEVGLRTQISSCRKRYLMKVQLDGKTHVLDFADRCAPLEPHDIVELINRGFDFSAGAVAPETLVIEYLGQLKSLARREQRLQVLSLVHSYLMRYQPFNLRHVSERARVAYETGDYRTAIDDIRSYFLYKPPELNNMGLKRIYKKALQRLRSNDC
jgi:regulator of sirC expression with transglutaminase-like and TPR domain